MRQYVNEIYAVNFSFTSQSRPNYHSEHDLVARVRRGLARYDELVMATNADADPVPIGAVRTPRRSARIAARRVHSIESKLFVLRLCPSHESCKNFFFCFFLLLGSSTEFFAGLRLPMGAAISPHEAIATLVEPSAAELRADARARYLTRPLTNLSISSAEDENDRFESHFDFF